MAREALCAQPIFQLNDSGNPNKKNNAARVVAALFFVETKIYWRRRVSEMQKLAFAFPSRGVRKPAP